MKGKTGTPSGKRMRDGSRPNAIGTSVVKEGAKDYSMTPDTFERSQARIKKKANKRSLNETYDGDITQLVGNYSPGEMVDILFFFSFFFFIVLVLIILLILKIFQLPQNEIKDWVYL